MKMRIGTKLNAIKAEKQLTQDEMAELMGISTSAYARLERNETSADLEQLTSYSKALDVPIHEFLPETFQINNHNHSGQGGLVFGNFYYYADNSSELARLQKENNELKQEIEALKNGKKKK